MASNSVKFSIVIPVYNEEQIIQAAADELQQGLRARKWDYEIIFAENGSNDATPRILEQMSKQDERIRWFHSEKPNYGAALKQGILEARGQYVICDEIDLCDLDFYDTALPLLDQGQADMVVGSKAAKGASDHRPWLRRAGTRVLNKLLKITLGFRGTDTHGLKAFRREKLLDVVHSCVVDMDVFASEFVIRAWREGLEILEIPIQLHEKRQPSIHLLRRVPSVVKNVSKLVYIIRVRGN